MHTRHFQKVSALLYLIDFLKCFLSFYIFSSNVSKNPCIFVCVLSAFKYCTTAYMHFHLFDELMCALLSVTDRILPLQLSLSLSLLFFTKKERGRGEADGQWMTEGLFVALWRQCCFLRFQHSCTSQQQIMSLATLACVHQCTGVSFWINTPGLQLSQQSFSMFSWFWERCWPFLRSFLIQGSDDLQVVSYGLQTNEHEEVKLDEWI